MKIRHSIPAVCALAALFAAAMPAWGQSAAGAQTSTSSSTSQTTTTQTTDSTTTHAQPGLTYQGYHKPTHEEKFKGYLFDAFGPYAIVGSIGAGAVHQASNAPPEWGQGWEAYGKRVGSSYGIGIVTQTTRYVFSELLREDTLYYRCECTGIFPRAKHALISTVTARKGEDGHRVFSIPAILAPYAGGETAALLWYPGRFGPKDGFRMGNYNLLDQAGMNLGLEFIWGGPHTLLSKVHVPIVSNATGSHPTQDKP
jgi:hypothetical protein